MKKRVQQGGRKERVEGWEEGERKARKERKGE